MSERPEAFVHLHVHSDYSLARGASRIPDLVARAAELGCPALALCDESAMYGAYDFSKVAYKAGVQPIIGVKLWLEMVGRDDRPLFGSVLGLALDQRGYLNLSRLTSRAWRPQPDGTLLRREGRPTLRVDALLEPGALDGVAVLSGGHDGLLWTAVSRGETAAARRLVRRMRETVGDRFYIEVCRNGRTAPGDLEAEEALVDLAYEGQGAPLVATSEVWYATPDRHDAYEILTAVGGKGTTVLADADGRIGRGGASYHLRSGAEMRGLFQDLPEAFENALGLARRCAFRVEDRKPLLPGYSSADGSSEESEMRRQAEQGLDALIAGGRIPAARIDEYRQRLAYELDVIEKMGFAGYFLIVADFIKWAKSEGIPVGPGRGSGAGSLVAWSLTITGLDPIRYGLLFERFLNPDRVSMPDFDIDFCKDRRNEVIRYVEQRYGAERVGQIATFMQIKSRTALKDVGRVVQVEVPGRKDEVQGFGFSELDRLSKMIPKAENSADPKTLADAYETVPEFQEAIDSEPKYRTLFAAARTIEGLRRSQGAHAAGIVIAGRPLQDLAPVGWDDETSRPLCQFDMKAAESVGLVKFDFLGLKTLSIIEKTLGFVRAKGVEVDISAIPLDDASVYEMLAQGRSDGVFQFESEGMKRALRDIRPDRLEDLIAIGALFRPGPMDMIPNYAARKQGRETPVYPEPVERTKPFLEETYGIMVYQEQVMMVAQVVAGYSLGAADLLRRAMGKKIPAEMAKQREAFVEGAARNGTPPAKAEALFDLIAKFAGYGFNKSHAAAYGLLSYQTAWLKRHHTAEFFAALLSYEEHAERMASIKREMEEFGVALLPPCIQRSHADFRPERGPRGPAIRFGLKAVKQISGDLAEFVAARGRGFADLHDFQKRAGALFNKGQVERLVQCGAFDAIEPIRARASSILSHIAKKKKVAGQSSLFGEDHDRELPEHVTRVTEWPDRHERAFQAVGFWFDQHPIDRFAPRLKVGGVRRLSSIAQYMRAKRIPELRGRRLCGLVEMVDTRRFTRFDGSEGLYLSARLAEKDDVYWVRFFDSDTRDAVRTELEKSRKQSAPVVILADVQVGADGRVSVTGKLAESVDEFVSVVKCDLRIRIDGEHVPLAPQDMHRLEGLRADLRRGRLSEADLERYRLDMARSAVDRVAQRAMSFLEERRSPRPDDGVGVEMMVRYADGGSAHLPVEGRFNLDEGALAELQMKAPGIHIEEKMPGPPAPSPLRHIAA